MRAYRKYRKWERRFEREHHGWAFVYQYGSILLAIYVIAEFVLSPICG